jgi:hypothetical protein
VSKFYFKGFELSYVITYSTQFNYYEARGEVNRIEKGEITFSREFRTEVFTYQGAEEEIKKLMKEFVEFEWQQFKLLGEDSLRTIKLKHTSSQSFSGYKFE